MLKSASPRLLSPRSPPRSPPPQDIFSAGPFTLSPTLEDELHAHLLAASLGDKGEELEYPPHERCVEIEIDLGAGDAAATVVGSDLTQEYVSINADYRS